MGRQPELGNAVWCARRCVSNPSGRKEFESCGGLTAGYHWAPTPAQGKIKQGHVQRNCRRIHLLATGGTARSRAEGGLARLSTALAGLSSFAVPPILEGKTHEQRN